MAEIKSMMSGKYKTKQDVIRDLNAKQDIKKFYQTVMRIKSEPVLEDLTEHSELLSLKAKTVIIKEGDKVELIPFLYNAGGIGKAYYHTKKGKKQIHCFAYLPGEPLVGIANLDKKMTSFLTIELVTDCDLVMIPADDIYRLSRESVEVALVCTQMQGTSSIREYEYEKMILSCNPMQRYEYFSETYPDIVNKVSKKEIASYLNMAPESLSRVLKKYNELHGDAGK